MRHHSRVMWLGWIAVFATSLVISCFLSRPFRLEWQTYAKIREGMTEGEVVAIIGVPPGIYTAKTTYYRPNTGPSDRLTVASLEATRSESAVASPRIWYTDNSFVWVDFDELGKVKTKHFQLAYADQPSILERIWGSVVSWTRTR